MRDALRVVVIILTVASLSLSTLAVTCLQHLYQGRLESHHSIFELAGDHQHSEPLSEDEDDCQLTSSTDHLLLTLAECKPCLMSEQALLSADQPCERFIVESPIAVLKVYHSPPVKPPTL